MTALLTPGLTTMAAIQAQARQRSGMVNNYYVGYSEWVSNIQRSYNTLYGLLASAFRVKFYSKQYTFITDGSTDQYPLPSDFWRVYGVDWVATPGTNLQNITLSPFEFNRRNQWNLPLGSVNGPGCAFYDVLNLTPAVMWLKPFPNGAMNFLVYYCPRPVAPQDAPSITLNGVISGQNCFVTVSGVSRNFLAGTYFAVGATDSLSATNLAIAINADTGFQGISLSAVAVGNVVTLVLNAPATFTQWEIVQSTFALNPDPNVVPLPFTNTLDLVNGWEEYLILDTACMALEKQEKDSSRLRANFAREEQRISVESKMRDVGMVPRIGGARGWRGGGNFGGRPGW